MNNLSFSINCKGKLVDLTKPNVMGILNVTPDSFFDGGNFNQLDSALFQIEKMLEDGATFIDIGGQSTRPDAEMISESEELKRVIPIIEISLKKFPEILISVDTFRSVVAQNSIESGACMVNDISGGNLDANMFETIAKLRCPYILMHIQGTPQNMQENPTYNNVTLDIIKELSEKIFQLRALKVNDIIIDPGFGFGKTLEQNFQLLRELDLFEKVLQVPVLAGLSRKSMIWKTLNSNAENALTGTITANTLALIKGAKILRVHDVTEAVECIKIYENYLG